MEGKRYSKEKTKKNNKRKLKKIIIPLILLICISIMIFTGIKIFNWLKENKRNKDIIEDISDSVTIDENTEGSDKFNVDFEKLRQTNPDTIAWLKVNGTDIGFPVVKAKDNDYYMIHGFDKSYNTAGWIFMDYKNKFDGTDKNMVIYGHNRRDGSIFGTLKNILTEDWQTNSDNFIIPFITENEKSEYQVFSIYKIEKEDYYITTNFGTDKEFQTFINKIKSRSVKDFNVNVTTEDHILTLSTCADNNKYRVVLHAKKIVE